MEIKKYKTPNSKWFPGEYLKSLGYRLNIVNGIMDDGKTYWMKRDMMDNFIKKGKRGIWVMNSGIALEEEIVKFKTDIENDNNDFRGVNQQEYWLEYKIAKITKTDTYVGKIGDEIVNYFYPITRNSKTARDSKVANIYYDEFNYGDKRIWNLQYKNFMVLLSRNMRNLEHIYLMGNATSINIPILVGLGVWRIDEEYTEFDLGNEKFLFFNFKRKNNEIEDKYKDSLAYQIMKKSDFINHAFHNEMLLDNMNNIIEDISLYEFYYSQSAGTFRLSNEIVIDVIYKKFNTENGNKSLYYLKLNKKKNPDIRFALSRDLVEDGIEYADDIAHNIANLFQRNKLYYENVSIKQTLFPIIKPKIFNLII